MSRPLRIAQVAPLFESVPPRLYGGTERIVSNLTEELVRRGHQVTLFASGDSRTAARLVATCPRGLRLDPGGRDADLEHQLMFERVLGHEAEFDLVHFHTETLHFEMARSLAIPSVSTMHGRLDLAQYAELFREFSDLDLVSISRSQMRPVASARWRGTVYHGLRREYFSLSEKVGDDLVFIGRLSEEKRVDRAIEIARRTGHRLKIAAKVDPEHDGPYLARIVPLLDQRQNGEVEFIGEVGDFEKARLLARAKALLFPIEWPEPFGLVMIESLACGTPVIAFERGSVPEIVRNGRTGFIVDSIDQACQAVSRLGEIDRRDCRADFEERFVVERMVDDYEVVYRTLVDERQKGCRWRRLQRQ